MTVADSRASASLRHIIEGLTDGDPEPEFVVRAFTAALDTRPENPERFPYPTVDDWKWLGTYAARTGQSWIIEGDWMLP